MSKRRPHPSARADGAIGLKINDRTLAHKIATGAFSAVFFPQAMEAIGGKNLQLDTGA